MICHGPPDPQIARSEVLRLFNHAQIYLLVGAAVTTVGLLAAAFSLLRRRLDPLLLWFAAFAILYGVRLDLNYQLLWACTSGLPPFSGLRSPSSTSSPSPPSSSSVPSTCSAVWDALSQLSSPPSSSASPSPS